MILRRDPVTRIHFGDIGLDCDRCRHIGLTTGLVAALELCNAAAVERIRTLIRRCERKRCRVISNGTVELSKLEVRKPTDTEA